MWPYYLLVILPIVFQYTTFGKKKLSKKKKTISIKIFWAILFIMLVLRHKSVGVDVYTYEYIFEYISNKNWLIAIIRSSEVLWNLLNKTISFAGGNFRCLIIIASFLSTYWVYKSYEKYSVDATLTISLYIITTNFILLFSGLKQSIAISLGFLAFEFVKNKKVIPFIIIIIIAMFIHTSAFMLFFMYPLYHIRLEKKWMFIIVVIFAIIWVYNRQIFTVLGLILNRFTDYDTRINGTGSVTMLILFIIFALFSYLIPNEKKMDDDTIAMRNYLLLSVAIQMFAPLHNLAMRMNYYYIAFIPLLIPKIIEYRSTRWSQVALIARNIMVIFFILYFFITAPNDNVLNTFPYKFFWSN